MASRSRIEDSFDVPQLPPRPPDDDPNADFLVRCVWNEEDNNLEQMHIRRRAQGERVLLSPELRKNHSYQLLKGREISQQRYPSGIMWRIKTRIQQRFKDPMSHKSKNSMYKLYITWDMNKQLQEVQITRYKCKNRIVATPILKKTYVLMDIFKSNYEFVRDGRGFLKYMMLSLGPKSGRFGPATAPANVVRYRNLVFRWGPNGEVTSTIVTNVDANSSGEQQPVADEEPEVLQDCNLVVLEPEPKFDPNDKDYGIPNHRTLIARRRFKKAKPGDHPNQRKVSTYPIRAAPHWITVDDSDFYLDVLDDESLDNCPTSEKNMWPYMKPKYEHRECLERKALYDQGHRECGDYDAFVFSEEYLKELIKIAEDNIAILTARMTNTVKKEPKQYKVPLDRIRNYYYLE